MQRKSVLFRFVSVLVLAGCLSAGKVRAGEFTDSSEYLTLSAPKIEVVDESSFAPLSSEAFLAGDQWVQELDTAAVVLDQIINLGRKTWAVVEANRPVVKVVTASANALPLGLSTWQELQGWHYPRARTYRVSYANLYGMTVVDFTYRVLYTAGGNFRGNGAYLANVTVVPVNLSVAWGFTFNATGAVVGITNAGSSSSPVAGMELLLSWSVDTALKHSRSSASFYVRGDGKYLNLGNAR